MLNTKILLEQTGIPPEWEHYIDDAASHVNTFYCQWGKPRSINYVAIADPHIGYDNDTNFNSRAHFQKQVNLINGICQTTKIDFVVVLGDLVDDNGADWGTAGAGEKRINDLQWIRRVLSTLPVPVLIVPGNHDLVQPGDYNLKREFFYNIINPIAEATVFTKNTWNGTEWKPLGDGWYNNYYCYDFEYLNLRCVCLGMTADQNYSDAEEFINTELFNTDKNIIIFNHGNFIDERLGWGSGENGNWTDTDGYAKGNKIIMDKIADAKNKVIAIHTGHVHATGFVKTNNIRQTTTNAEGTDESFNMPSGLSQCWSLTTNSAHPFARKQDPGYKENINKAFCAPLTDTKGKDKNKYDGSTPCFDIVSIIPLQGEGEFVWGNGYNAENKMPCIDVFHVGHDIKPIQLKGKKVGTSGSIENAKSNATTITVLPGQALTPQMLIDALFPKDPIKIDDVNVKAKGFYTYANGEYTEWWTEGMQNWVKSQHWMPYVSYPLLQQSTNPTSLFYCEPKEDV